MAFFYRSQLLVAHAVDLFWQMTKLSVVRYKAKAQIEF
jgi:hypothetical protein